MTLVMGGITIADPDSEPPVEGERVLTGQQTRAHDGTLNTSYTNLKWKWRLKWTYLTADEYALVLARADTVATQTMVLPWDATSYTVVVKQDTVKYHAMPSSDNFYIEFEVEESV
jgi:hypothetical protein